MTHPSNSAEVPDLSVIPHIHQLDERTYSYFRENYQPIFILNSGRSGSALIYEIFKKSTHLDSFHEASPVLMMLTNFAFQNQEKKNELEKIIEASRMELLLESFLQGKNFVESNHCLVFFARQIRQLFPMAKFIHLIRHPANFIRSGVLKGWYLNDSIWEINRIKMSDEVTWSGMSQVEKLAWNWKVTHEYIDSFKKEPGLSTLTVRLEDLTSSEKTFSEMSEFVDNRLVFKPGEIRQLQQHKINEVVLGNNDAPGMHKKTSYPDYADWCLSDKELVRKHTAGLAVKYNYAL
jgi:hypothetical protein